MNKERQVCARRRDGEPAMSSGVEGSTPRCLQAESLSQLWLLSDEETDFEIGSILFPTRLAID